MNAMLSRSPSPTSSLAMASVLFSVGTLSPVRAASSISSVAATMRRPSAGTRLPASNNTMSPGTRVSATTSITWPSRRTRAMFFISFSSEARLSSAFDSWRRPITALATVRTTNITLVRTSRVKTKLMAAAASRMICMKSRYWRRNACHPDSFFFPASWLGPYFCRRACASAALRPLAGSTSRRRATSASDSWYQRSVSPAFMVFLLFSLAKGPLRRAARYDVQPGAVRVQVIFIQPAISAGTLQRSPRCRPRLR